MTVADSTPRAGRREWIGLALLVLPTFVVAIDLFVLLLALPNLSTHLGASSTEQLWIMDTYGFLLAGLLLTMGTLGDRIGRRRLLMFGAAGFGVASLLCAYSVSPEMLIAARALLGISGAALGPATLALIAGLFKDPKQMAVAFGIWGGAFTIGAIVGPVIGGAMLAGFWWGSVFLLGVPVMLLVVVAGRSFLPESRNPQAGRLDPTSVVLSLGALLLVVFGIKQLALNGFSTVPVLALVLGIVAGVVFVRRQNRLDHPLLDLGLFRNRTISTSLLGQLCYSTTGGGLMLMMMLYLQLVQGMTALQAGLAMVPGMLGGAIGFSVAPRLAARFRPAHVIAAGLAVNAVVTGLVFTQIGTGSGVPALVIGFAVLSFCGAPMAGLGVALAIGSSPPEKVGTTGSLSQMANEFGGTLGIAILGTVGAAVYRRQIADAVPAGTPADAAAAAHDSISGAVTAASGLPGPTGTALLVPAQEAFVTGLHTVSGIAAVVLLAAAALVLTRLRAVPPIGQAPASVEAPAAA